MIGCNGIRVKVESDCIWAKMAPELTESHIADIGSSNIEDDTFEAIKRLDNWIPKHNENYVSYCK